MKNTKKIILFVLLATLLSCNDDFLDVQPSSSFSDAVVWTDPVLVKSFVNQIYTQVPNGFRLENFAVLCDDGVDTAGFDTNGVVKSELGPSSYDILSPNHWDVSFKKYHWASLYKQIRACNIFLDKTSANTSSETKQLKGEVLFLRAHFYELLVIQYGGVPLINKALLPSDDLLTPRNSFGDCITFIVKDLDDATALLPLNGDKARATKGAALTLKSRILTHAASDLYNSNGSFTNNYSNKELIGYTTSNRTARWQAAKDASKAVIDLGIYSLYGGTNPGSVAAATENYTKIFLNNGSAEDIFITLPDNINNNRWDTENPGLFNGPNGYHNWGNSAPSGQVVDAYEMIDGSKFSWNNSTHKARPYANRDPRFYANVLYDGAKWRQRPDDVIASDPLGIVQTGKYQTATGTFIPGLDTRQGPIEDWNGTYTGYYTRKFIDPAINHQYTKQKITWRQMRYAEVLLNYAEACLGLGQEAEAIQYINMIRSRAGMPNVTGESGQTLVDRYRNERRIELVNEQHRFFDIRRWMIAPQVMVSATGIDITHFYNSTTSYTVKLANSRLWLNKAYFLPIQQDEINKNKNLIQNPGY